MYGAWNKSSFYNPKVLLKINKYLQKLAAHIHECGLVSYSWEGQVGMMGGGWDSALGIL